MAVIRPANSIKEFVFPRHETLYGYRFGRKRVELAEIAPAAERADRHWRPAVRRRVRPILDHVFNWDYADGSYNRRRELTTVVTLACQSTTPSASARRSAPGPAIRAARTSCSIALDEGIFEVRCLTEKGRRLFAGHDRTVRPQGVGECGAGQLRFDLDRWASSWPAASKTPQWQDLARRCLGCGACAYTCPTCHCFDIVDEGGRRAGVRARNWDACQFAMFTLHASGHNPRSQQAQRQRQRIYHKFQIYPEKFGDVLCTGCGNCTRNCPVGLGVRPVLAAIARIGSETETK